jgi:hypothetical protein
MNGNYFIGHVKRRIVKLEDATTARVQFSCKNRPQGTSLDLPEGAHSNRAQASLDHSDDPIGVKVVQWTGEHDDPSSSDVAAFLDRDEPVQGARLIGDAQVVAEQAVRLDKEEP